MVVALTQEAKVIALHTVEEQQSLSKKTGIDESRRARQSEGGHAGTCC
jgi:hypothetical protein